MKFFNCPILKAYNPILKFIYENFHKSEVKLDIKNEILIIKSEIVLRLSFSSNEYKIYFTPAENPAHEDRNYFRFFESETIIKYLQIKVDEIQFIRKNAG